MALAEATTNTLQSDLQTAAPVISKSPGASSQPRLSHNREEESQGKDRHGVPIKSDSKSSGSRDSDPGNRQCSSGEEDTRVSL